MLDSGRKLGGATEHLIDGSEKRICRLSFEFWSPHVIESLFRERQNESWQTPLRKQHSSDSASNYTPYNLLKLIFLQIPSENLRSLTQFMKKYSSYIFLFNQSGSIFKKELIYRRRCGIMFCYLFWVRVMQHDFPLQSDIVS